MLRKDPFITAEYYHIYNRGIDKRIIFKSTYDFNRFIMLLYIANSEDPIRLDNLINILHKSYDEILNYKKGKPLVSIGAYCLMTNHFHLLVRQEVDGGITKFMKKLGIAYAMYFNIKYQRKGALFGGLFKSKLIDKDDRYMNHLFGYIHLNSLDIKFSKWEESLTENQKEKIDFLENYKYSSYQDYIGIDRVEKSILNKEAFPKYFENMKEFKDFVEGYFIDLENRK